MIWDALYIKRQSGAHLWKRTLHISTGTPEFPGVQFVCYIQWQSRAQLQKTQHTPGYTVNQNNIVYIQGHNNIYIGVPGVSERIPVSKNIQGVPGVSPNILGVLKKCPKFTGCPKINSIQIFLQLQKLMLISVLALSQPMNNI